MGTKHDMYIEYKRSEKRRGKRKNRKLRLLLFIVIIIAGLGITAWYITKNSAGGNKQQAYIPTPAYTSEEITKISPTPALSLTPMPTSIPDIFKVPSSSPTPAAEIEITPVNMEVARNPVIAKGLYISANTAGSDRINHLMELSETTEINALIIDVKDDHGKISFEMESPKAKEIGAVTHTISDINTLIATLKSKNIYLIARIVAFKDPYLAEKRTELAIRNQDGSLFRDNNGECWVNPYNKEVWKYLIELASQAAAVGFDEVQFDYIRFSTGKGIANADFGEEAKTKSKEEIITEFTKYAYDSLRPLGVFISADVYGAIINSTVDAGLVGQNFTEMAKHLDYICPMIYPSHFGEGNYGIKYPDLEPYNIIKKAMTTAEEKLSQLPEKEHRAIVRPWLQDFTATWVKHHIKYGKVQLRQQMKGVYDAGISEWLLWNAGSVYTESGLLEE